MRIKKAGGKVYGADFTAAERKAMNLEIQRQLAEHSRKHANEIDAIILWQLHAQYGFGNRFNHEVRQQRRLLMHRNEILKLAQWLGTKGGTIIPLKFYLKQGLVKVEIAYCQGKNRGDKRETLRRKQSDMEMRRQVKR